MEGAVIFGLHPNQIIQRKAKYTIGNNECNKQNEELLTYKDEKYYYKEEGIYYCKNCFSSFITINQNLNLAQEIKENYVMNTPRYCTIKFYITLKPNPILFDEEGVEEIGLWLLDPEKEFPPGEIGFYITMRIGGYLLMYKQSTK